MKRMPSTPATPASPSAKKQPGLLVLLFRKLFGKKKKKAESSIYPLR